MKNKKIIDRLKALEKSFHLGAIPLFQLNSFRNRKEKRAMESGFDFAEKEGKVIIFHLIFFSCNIDMVQITQENGSWLTSNDMYLLLGIQVVD